MKKAILVLILISLNGCLGVLNTEPPEMMSNEAQTKFTFNYEIDGVSKNKLWKRARDYFAGVFGDSRAVFRVMDERDGTIIGKGSTSWSYSIPGVTGAGFEPYIWVCRSDYHIRFAAKDNKARLQMEIIRGVPAKSPCSFKIPTREGYEEIKRSFVNNSKALKDALEGRGSSSDLKDF